MTPFERRVLLIVSRVPAGRVITYGEVAKLAGKPRAARAVGHLMGQGTHPGLPYHRVVAAGGRLGGYSSLALKRSLLTAEGLTVTATRVVGFARVRWPEKTGPRARKRAPVGRPGRRSRKNRREG